MCIQWTRVLYFVVIKRQSNSPISQFNSLCNEFKSVWSMFACNMFDEVLRTRLKIVLLCSKIFLNYVIMMKINKK